MGLRPASRNHKTTHGVWNKNTHSLLTSRSLIPWGNSEIEVCLKGCIFCVGVWILEDPRLLPWGPVKKMLWKLRQRRVFYIVQVTLEANHKWDVRHVRILLGRRSRKYKGKEKTAGILRPTNVFGPQNKSDTCERRREVKILQQS